jgi:WD40 repeat protein/tRNA A-37 threonylcarbamoyl transferase component Bud32
MSSVPSDHPLTPFKPDEPGPLSTTVGEVKKIAGLRYQILRPHDKGGIGEVFVALDQELNREVALKEIQERHAADEHSRGRFVREAEITGGLEHPGIVPVYGLGQYADGRPFYAMRFIQGETLKDAIAHYHRSGERRSRSPEFELRSLLTRFVAVCNAIAYAYSRGVIHRDIKPSNIMLGKYGETLVVDWGLAKGGMNEPVRSASDGLPEPTLVPSLAHAIETQAGSAMGTPAYMSPEQASGRLDLLGPASDIYSLGATLYTLLTGRPPIEGKDTAEVLRKAQRGEWLPVRQVKPEVPSALAAICQKAMAASPSARYATALELAADVEHWLADEPVSAHRESWGARSRRWMRRHRTLVSTGVGVLVIALLSATVGLVLITDAWDEEATARKTAENKEREAREQKEEAQKQKKEADRQREEARFNKYVAQMNLLQRDYEVNNMAHARELLEEQVPQEEGITDWRGFEWYYWQRMTHRELLILQGATDVAFSSDGRRLASADYQTVRVWDTATGQKLLTVNKHEGWVNSVAFSPDGRWLASAGDDQTVRLWDSSTGRELLILKEHNGRVNGVVFSPDGRRLASAGSDTMVRVWDAATGWKLLTLNKHEGPVNSVAFSPDGRRLASASGQTVRLWDSSTGQELLTLSEHVGTVVMSFSPDSRRLASADFQTVRIWDAVTGQKLLTIQEQPRHWFQSVAFSPDGRRLASVSTDQMVRLWDAATGKELFSLKGHTNWCHRVVFSPDGRHLASASRDQTVRVWDATTRREGFALEGHRGPLNCVNFSPDGRRLASAGIDRTVRVWNAMTGQELLCLKGHTNEIVSIAFSPDGRRLASASSDQTVRLWDVATGKESLTLRGHKNWVVGVAFSSDGQRLASAGWDDTVRVWDAATGKELLILHGNRGEVECMAFSLDGRRLASAGQDKLVRIWDTATGKILLTLRGHTNYVWSMAFSPDGRRLASAGVDHTVRVWDATTGQELLTLKGHRRGVVHVAFSPDGRRLASTSGQRRLWRVWNNTTGAEALITTGSDDTVRIWDAATGRELLTLNGPPGGVRGVAFSPDGRQLASACFNGIVQIWEALRVSEEVWRHRSLVSQVGSLFRQLLLREDVLAVLRKDSALSEAERCFAVQVAREHPEDPDALNDTAWKVVKTRDAGKEAYVRALRRAEAAVRLAPENSFLLNTLGVAQYRAGRYADALNTLTQSEKLNATKEGSIPADLVFLAMAQHQLGKKDEAKATLYRLRKVMKQPRWSNAAESADFLREAEELIEGKGGNKTP